MTAFAPSAPIELIDKLRVNSSGDFLASSALIALINKLKELFIRSSREKYSRKFPRRCEGSKEFLQAVRLNNFQKVQEILLLYSYIVYQYDHGSSPLSICCDNVFLLDLLNPSERRIGLGKESTDSLRKFWSQQSLF